MKKSIKTNKGFTLVELLAVIVILGLLMAIAIPSVTKYITQSRKKTLMSTMDSYVTAVTNAVNDNEFGALSTSDIIYYIPVSDEESNSCVSLEKGGTDPFGNWLEAYVAVNYDAANYSYDYYFTFYDDAGYGMELTNIDDLSSSGSKIINPSPVNADNITLQTNGRATQIKVLTSGSCDVKTAIPGGNVGDNNLNQNNEKYLVNLIKKQNDIVTSSPTLTTSSNNTSDVSGLYSSNATNTGNLTYYFRGNVENNFVSFAGFSWRIVRINEDGTIRLILNERINDTNYSFSNSISTMEKMYYSNGSNAKSKVDSWYKTNISDKGYDSHVANGIFCEQAKVKYSNDFSSGNATMSIYTSYIPNFKCETDGNEKGIINSKTGLITYDEVIYAGGYYQKTNKSYYLYNGSYSFWTMSPAGFYSSNYANGWNVSSSGHVFVTFGVYYTLGLRPVINLNANVIATGTGTSSDPYVVQTN